MYVDQENYGMLILRWNRWFRPTAGTFEKVKIDGGGDLIFSVNVT
jgi:hypothetical protein